MKVSIRLLLAGILLVAAAQGCGGGRSGGGPGGSGGSNNKDGGAGAGGSGGATGAAGAGGGGTGGAGGMAGHDGGAAGGAGGTGGSGGGAGRDGGLPDAFNLDTLNVDAILQEVGVTTCAAGVASGTPCARPADSFCVPSSGTRFCICQN